MLSHLTIDYLAIVEHLDLVFKSGMTVLTGETGAGKSILIDALSLVLGGRADCTSIRHGAEVAEVSATFELPDEGSIQSWLVEQGLAAGGECIIRRTIHKDGRSRAYINGYLSPLTQIRTLGERLVDIHGQHQNQALLKSDYQQLLLDAYAGHHDLLLNVRNDFEQWHLMQKECLALQSLQDQRDKLALLHYQIRELEDLAVKQNELEQLETEHRALTHAESWLVLSNQALAALHPESVDDVEFHKNYDACAAIHQALMQLQLLKAHSPSLLMVEELLNNALIQIEESVSELKIFVDAIVYDPKRLMVVEERMGVIHSIARKYKIPPETLNDHLIHLKREATTLSDVESSLSGSLAKLNALEAQYKHSAALLSKSRQVAALVLSGLVVQSLQLLEMPNGRFEVRCSPKNGSSFSIHGSDTIDFLVSTNPGHPLQPLKKVASGGELSRISLAIQVITAQKITIPTLIFDEVDVGISGKTAEVVGKLIRTLSEQTQVLCVTHLPQVAAQSHHHYKVEKQQTADSTTTHIKSLDAALKVQEIARLLGGITVTQSALHHAEEMVQSVI